MFKRIALFLVTNLAVLLVLSVVLRLLGVDQILDESGAGINYESLLVLSLVIGFGGSFISLAMSKWMAKRSTGARVIEQPSNEAEAWLVATVERQARQAGIETPEVAVYDAPDMNAFATGARRNAALVAVSTGLLRGMPRDEVEAVLAHEVAHVANGDMVTLALVQGVLNTFVVFFSRIIGHLVDRVVFRNERGYGMGYFMVTMAAQVLLGVLASVIVMWVSRQREFRADAGSAEIERTRANDSCARSAGGRSTQSASRVHGRVRNIGWQEVDGAAVHESSADSGAHCGAARPAVLRTCRPSPVR